MTTTTASTVLRNIASNWTGYFVNAAVIFFLTPFVVGALGDSRYGVWLLISSLTGYYGLLDAGLRGGITQYTTRHLATGDHDRLNATLSTALVAMGCVAVVVMILAGGLSLGAPLLFKIPAEITREVSWCILIVGISTAMQLTLFPYAAVLTGAQRFDLLNLVAIATRLVSAVLIWAALSRGSGLIAISLINGGTELCGYLARRKLAHVVVPALQVRLRYASRATLREIYSYGLWTFLTAIAGSVFAYAGPVIIGANLPVAAVAWYGFATALCHQLESIIRPVDQVFYPLLTQLHATDKEAAMRRVYIAGTRVSAVISVALAVATALWCDDFYRYWIGPRYVETGGEFPSVSVLCQWLLIGMVGRMVPTFAGQVLMASLRVRAVAIQAISDAVVNLILAILLVRWWGLMGVVVASIVPILIVRVGIAQLMVIRLMKVPIGAFLWQAGGRSAVVGVAIAAIVIGVRSILPSESLGEVIGHGLLSALVAAPFVLLIGLDRDERARFVKTPLARLWSRVSGRAVAPPIPDVAEVSANVDR